MNMKVKNWLKKNMFAICNAGLAYFFFYHISGHSFGLFGEPDFPVE